MADQDVCSFTLPIVDWVKKEGKECKPCLFSPLAQWYYSVLKENGLTDLMEIMEKTIDNEDISKEEMAKLFDSVKDRVSDAVKERLKEFDCTIQNFKEAEEDEEKENG